MRETKKKVRQLLLLHTSILSQLREPEDSELSISRAPRDTNDDREESQRLLNMLTEQRMNE